MKLLIGWEGNKRASPETIVIISSHGPVFTDAICIYDYPLKGNLSSFNAPEVELSFAADEDLKKDILKRSEKYDIPVVRSGEINITRYGFREELDHGVMVPMYFINKFTSNFKLLPIAFGMLPYEDLYSFGKLIKESAEALNKRVIVIASGDFSHKLTPDAPAGYTPQGKVFDEKLVAILRDFDIAALSNWILD